MLELKNIKAGYGKKAVLENVSVKLRDNCITVIMGANGAGKSTLLKTAFGIIRAMDGKILLDGTEIRPTPQMLVKNGVYFVPQRNRVFPDMTVRENIELATHSWTDKSIFDERLRAVLEYFPDLKTRLDARADTLSGGQQQMVALARGLVGKPKMIFMDEPSIGLAPKLINDVFHKIKDLKEKTGTAFVIVEHNLKTLLPLTDWAYILQDGRVAYDGSSNGKTLEKMTSVVFK
ncbi:MAG: ABC transporter ATP-binding protein [Alphaproteobacteria bacterium]|nr:ABC transporter ATP-binding protein [Alphaproteobacteria bacterium]